MPMVDYSSNICQIQLYMVDDDVEVLSFVLKPRYWWYRYNYTNPLHVIDRTHQINTVHEHSHVINA